MFSSGRRFYFCGILVKLTLDVKRLALVYELGDYGFERGWCSDIEKHKYMFKVSRFVRHWMIIFTCTALVAMFGAT